MASRKRTASKKRAATKKRGARWLARVRLVGTRALFLVWTACAIGLGLIFGWGLFAEPHKLGEPSFGNIAEWIGAAATLVIGVAAWRYQSESFTLGMRKELRVARMAYNGILWKAKRCVAMEDPLDTFLALPPEEQYLGKLHGYLDIVTNVSTQIAWSESERSYLDDPALDALVILEFELFVYIDVVKHVMSDVDEVRGELLSTDRDADLAAVTKQASDVADAARTLIPLIEALRDRETRLLGGT